MIRVTILGDVWDSLRDRCNQSAPLEDGGFVLTRPVETASGVRLVVDQEVAPPNYENRWNIQEQRRLRPTTRYKSKVMGESFQTDRVPFFVHSHPDGPPGFSYADELMHEAWLRDFVESSAQGAFGSLVIHGNDVTGKLWTGIDYADDQHEVDVVNCCGSRPIRSVRNLDDAVPRDLTGDVGDGMGETSTTNEVDPLEIADRQLQLIDRLGQARLTSAKVGIVGLGGTGSATAIQCARAGIGSLLLADPDTAEISNANRLYSLTLEQAREGTAKTKVLEDHLGRTATAEVETIQDDVTTGSYDEELLDCDVIFGCTDRHTPRDYLNKLSVLYGIPYIDVGTRPTANDGLVLDLFADARHVVNGGPCLWCLDVLDPGKIREENMPKELVDREVKDGYRRDEGPEPSNVFMTTMAATMGAVQAVAYLLNQENIWDEMVVFNLWACDLQRYATDRADDCVCQKGQWSPSVHQLSLLSF
ncbi:ThiF family adenylyltransferase [Halorussus limi]|uniref:ThiF family adenylyltransferase n=1 Tax=Halorussus limi TaxID=2938695 RepID=A0A8U0HXL5_9EURY|nr:ThiF family adenylyltransferase [Halorussus limi]UPV75882.1 ThiF family adenylyltransferase [Halorussus limi]